MTTWLLMVLVTAFGGALLLWYSVSATKHFSDEMLNEYRDMLAEAREKKMKELIAEAEEEAEEERRRQQEAQKGRPRRPAPAPEAPIQTEPIDTQPEGAETP